MKDKIQYIIIGLLVLIFIQGFFKSPEGVSEEEVAYRIRIHELNKEKHQDLERINELQNKNKVYENLYDSLQNDNSIDTATANELQSALSRYANSRR